MRGDLTILVRVLCIDSLEESFSFRTIMVLFHDLLKRFFKHNISASPTARPVKQSKDRTPHLLRVHLFKFTFISITHPRLIQNFAT